MSTHLFVAFPKNKTAFETIGRYLVEQDDLKVVGIRPGTNILAILFCQEGVAKCGALKNRVVHGADDWQDEAYASYDWVDRLEGESDSDYLTRATKVIFGDIEQRFANRPQMLASVLK